MMNGRTSQVRPARVVIADDHPLFRSAMRHILTGNPELEVVGEASDGQEALELCRRLRPELVLMDVSMPKMDGLAATCEIKREQPRTIVVVLTADQDPNRLAAALKAGAAGYILKTASPQQIIGAILRALSGESPLNEEIAVHLLRRLLEDAPEQVHPAPISPTRPLAPSQEPLLPCSLTAREAEILRLMSRGHTNQQIARDLLISVSTVKKHVQSIISKLGVSDRTQAAVRAIELGIRPEQREEGE